jgi:hypothetical protein
MQKKPTVVIITPHLSKRLQYVCQWVFEQRLQIRYAIITPESVNSFQKIDLAYGMKDVRAVLGMVRGRWIEEGYFTSTPPGIYRNGRLVLPEWEPSDSHAVPDIFSALFWALTRAEEYEADQRDRHGRFSADSSWAYKHKVLELPWVDIAVGWLAKSLGIQSDQEVFSVRPSLDIDEAYAFKSRSWRAGAGLLMDLIKGRFDLGIHRLKWLINKEVDPFDTFHEIDRWLGDLKKDTYVFFLLGDPVDPLDRNISASSPALAKLINGWTPPGKLGLHPSYRTLEDPALLVAEKQTLERVAGREVLFSRFHYLRFQMPGSYRQLIEVGMSEDHSMVYPDAVGFRAGTGCAFNWYDLERETGTSLKVCPYVVMDRTLKDYRSLSPSDAVAKVRFIISICRENQIPFGWVWHNSTMGSLEGWDAYKAVRDELA